MLVFVYGTLRKQQINHYMMKNYRCIAEDVWVYGKLYDAGAGYPFLALNRGREKVRGEIFAVPQSELYMLDEFEDYTPNDLNSLYVRVEVEVYDNNNNTTKAFTYVCNKEEMLLHEIEGHDWARFLGNLGTNEKI
ncbi:gamma-glutamylcyclotransferase family protein [Niallia circulans]|uniref:gamma-glutamylcyclotransferase family protein n=1 Tax=Niallia circulans TaxID=1397 RepID=UPI001F29737A|nr:gamma-glutamylcyclotransferase family protein [Niallia circulans]